MTYKGLRSREGSASTSKGAGQVADSPGFDAREGWQSGLQAACRCLETNKEQMRALHDRWRRATVVRSRPLKTRGQPVALFKVHTFQALMWKEMPIFCATTTGTTSMLPRLPACGVADAQAICSPRRNLLASTLSPATDNCDNRAPGTLSATTQVPTWQEWMVVMDRRRGPRCPQSSLR